VISTTITIHLTKEIKGKERSKKVLMNMHRNEEAASYVNILFSIRAGWGVNPTSP
jgi:hypothetical protein